MAVLRLSPYRFAKVMLLKGIRMSGCLHITTETANLAITLKAGGADLVLCASNPLSTQDDVAAALVSEYTIPTYAIKGEDEKTYYRHINAVLDHRPNMTMDDGCDLVSTLHTTRTELIPAIIAGMEETTTGVIRLHSMEKKGVLRFPVLAVNESDTKHMFDNRYGTGQSSIDAIIRATKKRRVRDFVDEYTYADGRQVHLLAEGRLVNLSAAEGHPASVMDMSFANQALGAEYMLAHAKELQPRVYTLPAELDKEIARLKLHAMGVRIDTLTPEQEHYLNSWESGT